MKELNGHIKTLDGCRFVLYCIVLLVTRTRYSKARTLPVLRSVVPKK